MGRSMNFVPKVAQGVPCRAFASDREGRGEELYETQEWFHLRKSRKKSCRNMVVFEKKTIFAVPKRKVLAFCRRNRGVAQSG